MEPSLPTAHPITSAPGLAAAIRATDCRGTHRSWQRLLKQDPLVAVYRVAGATLEAEVESAAHTAAHVMDRMRRLRVAYGEWAEFDAGAYFDLTYAQAARLVTVTERVATVHVFFRADLLLPAFQRAESFWCETFQPLHRTMVASLLAEPAAAPSTNGASAFFDDGQPRLVELWQQLCATIARVRHLLREDAAFWSMDGAAEERWRWRPAWRSEPASGLDSALRPPLESVPTLTLAYDFPLPAHRQPGRLRRLRRLRSDRMHRRHARLVRDEQI